MIRFEGKVGLVTGAGQGLGKEGVLGLAREGGKVVVIDINEAGSEAIVIVGDISNRAVQEGCDREWLEVNFPTQRDTLRTQKHPIVTVNDAR